jgi:hypothetical protein
VQRTSHIPTPGLCLKRGGLLTGEIKSPRDERIDPLIVRLNVIDAGFKKHRRLHVARGNARGKFRYREKRKVSVAQKRISNVKVEALSELFLFEQIN